MINKVVASFDDAVADVPDGATVMIGGFGAMDRPFGLIRALRKRGARNLTIIANSPGTGGQNAIKWWGLTEYVDANLLVENSQVKKFISSITFPGTTAEKAWLAGEIEIEFTPQGTLAERIRAGGFGIGGFYVRTGVGTVIAEGKETRTINGEEYLFEMPLKADYSLIKAYTADIYGNLSYRGNTRDFNAVMAPAANITIAEVEAVVEMGKLGPDLIVTPGVFVNRIVEIPRKSV